MAVLQEIKGITPSTKALTFPRDQSTRPFKIDKQTPEKLTIQHKPPQKLTRLREIDRKAGAKKPSITMSSQMKQQHWILLATTALLVSPLTVRNAGAQMMQGVCSYSTNYGTRTAWKKLCVMDPRNSGNIEVITNNGSIWFMLNDSRNNTYKYNQKIWVLETIGGYVGNGASFRSGGDVLTFAVLR